MKCPICRKEVQQFVIIPAPITYSIEVMIKTNTGYYRKVNVRNICRFTF